MFDNIQIFILSYVDTLTPHVSAWPTKINGIPSEASPTSTKSNLQHIKYKHLPLRKDCTICSPCEVEFMDKLFKRDKFFGIYDA